MREPSHVFPRHLMLKFTSPPAAPLLGVWSQVQVPLCFCFLTSCR